MRINSVEDVARLFGVAEATEEAINRAIYEHTASGVRVKFHKVATGTYEWQHWKIHIRDSLLGPCVIKARRAKGRKWYMPEEMPGKLFAWLGGVEWKGPHDSLCVMTDEDAIQIVRNNPPKHPQRYWDAEIKIYVGGMADGMSCWASVEGVEMPTETYTVIFPCDSDKVNNALNEVEEEAAEIWKQTHGCPDCYGGKMTVNIWGWISEDGDDLGARVVDPDCPTCHGQGMPI